MPFYLTILISGVPSHNKKTGPDPNGFANLASELMQTCKTNSRDFSSNCANDSALFGIFQISSQIFTGQLLVWQKSVVVKCLAEDDGSSTDDSTKRNKKIYMFTKSKNNTKNAR